MGKIVAFAAIALFTASRVVYAGWWDSGTPKSATNQPASAPAASGSSSASKAASTSALLAKKSADFNNTQWTVDIRPMNGKGQMQEDTLTFSGGQVVAKNVGPLGYVPTNFSVRLLDDGTFVWETMQTSDKDGVMSWRGDIGSDGTMHGVISKHDKKNNGSDFTFVSVGSKAITPPAPAASVPPAAAPAND